MGQFTFINTSGGSTEAANTKIRTANNMTSAGVSAVTGKPILADTGYGASVLLSRGASSVGSGSGFRGGLRWGD